MSGSSAHSYWSHSSICMHILTTVLMMCDGDGGFATYFKNLQSIAQSTRTMHHFFFFFIFFSFLSNTEWKLTCKRKHWSPCPPTGKISTRLLQFIAFLSGLSKAHDNFLWPGGLLSGRQNLMVWRTTGRRPLQTRVMEKAVNRSWNGEGRQQPSMRLKRLSTDSW